MSTAIASWNFSRKRTSSMHVSSGRPHMLTSNQRGRGNDPVVVLGRMRPSVAVNMGYPQGMVTRLALACTMAALIGGVARAADSTPAALYKQHCGMCHDNPGETRAPAAAVMRQMSPEAIVNALENGLMKEQGKP